ncbi:MAG: hypothetical protein GY822_20040 [Deltaproteobacteria bacterium]|nr:hypothetical protein [Deltaproteobacteria bacterium]
MFGSNLGKDSEKEVVLKELRTELMKTPEQHELLQTEKSLQMQLNDPRIPSLLASRLRRGHSVASEAGFGHGENAG